MNFNSHYVKRFLRHGQTVSCTGRSSLSSAEYTHTLNLHTRFSCKSMRFTCKHKYKYFKNISIIVTQATVFWVATLVNICTFVKYPPKVLMFFAGVIVGSSLKSTVNLSPSLYNMPHTNFPKSTTPVLRIISVNFISLFLRHTQLPIGSELLWFMSLH